MKNKEERLRNPEPGSKAAAARDFGIDLTLLIERLRLTPEERLVQLQNVINDLSALRQAPRKTIAYDSDSTNP